VAFQNGNGSHAEVRAKFRRLAQFKPTDVYFIPKTKAGKAVA
jgi:hypothetical protein